MFNRDNHALTPANDGLAGVIPRADRLAHHYGLYCGYDVTGAALQELPTDLVEIEAACGGIGRVLDRAFSFIESASGTPGHWFAAA